MCFLNYTQLLLSPGQWKVLLLVFDRLKIAFCISLIWTNVKWVLVWLAVSMRERELGPTRRRASWEGQMSKIRRGSKKCCLFGWVFSPFSPCCLHCYRSIYLFSQSVRGTYSMALKQFACDCGTQGNLCTVIVSQALLGLCTINSFPVWFLLPGAASLRYWAGRYRRDDCTSQLQRKIQALCTNSPSFH